MLHLIKTFFIFGVNIFIMTNKELFDILIKAYPGKKNSVKRVQHALSMENLMAKYKDPVTLTQVAWAIFTLAASGAGRVEFIREWIGHFKDFYKTENNPIDLLVLQLKTPENMPLIDSIMISTDTGKTFVRTKAGFVWQSEDRTPFNLDFENMKFKTAVFVSPSLLEEIGQAIKAEKLQTVK